MWSIIMNWISPSSTPPGALTKEGKNCRCLSRFTKLWIVSPYAAIAPCVWPSFDQALRAILAPAPCAASSAACTSSTRNATSFTPLPCFATCARTSSASGPEPCGSENTKFTRPCPITNARRPFKPVEASPYARRYMPSRSSWYLAQASASLT
jgi:hypothetical protein